MRLSPEHPRHDEILRRHEAALTAGSPTYVDPDTGLWVFTAAYLADRGYCCETGCRHCPYRDSSERRESGTGSSNDAPGGSR